MEKQQSTAAPGEMKPVSRREFIATAAAGVVALGAVGIGGFGFVKPSATSIDKESSGVIYPDPSLCIGCLSCEVACTDAHRQAEGLYGLKLSSISRIRIYTEPQVKVDPEVAKSYPNEGAFFQHICLQCPDAPCVPVCPVNSMHVEPKTGARVIDEKTCIACGRCMEACPFEVRPEEMARGSEKTGQRTRITYDKAKNVYTKCDLCYFRPEGPACIQRCPINIRIKTNVLKVAPGRMCLDLPKSDQAHFVPLRESQTYKKS